MSTPSSDTDDSIKAIYMLASEIVTVFNYLESLDEDTRSRVSVLVINADSYIAGWGITGLFGYPVIFQKQEADNGVPDETWIRWEEELKEG